MTLSMNWTESDLINYIRIKLGHPVTLVELDDDQIKSAIYDSLEIYNVYLGKPVRFLQSVTEGDQVISITDPGRGVIAVRTLTRTNINNGISNFDIFGYNQNYSGTDAGGLATDIENLEQMNRVMGTEFDWEYVEEESNLYLSAVPSSVSQIECIKLFDRTLNEIPSRHYQWFRKYAIASAKLILGRLLSKVKSIPSPTGELTLDGEDLISQGREDIIELEARLEDMREDLIIQIG